MPQFNQSQPKPLTLFQQHVADWRDCLRCDLCETRRNVVIMRGSVPSDIVFVGMAPGESEDSIGIPFVGPAGYLLNQIIDRTIGPKGNERYKYSLTNLVCCIPRDESSKKGYADPEDEHIQSCRPRLEEFINRIAKPRLIICVGALARDWLDGSRGKRWSIDVGNIPSAAIPHPSFILKRPIGERGYIIQESIAVIITAIEEYIEGLKEI
jgi:uracil-DNA glycosylase